MADLAITVFEMIKDWTEEDLDNPELAEKYLRLVRPLQGAEWWAFLEDLRRLMAAYRVRH